MRHNKVTMADVARRAGVAPTTVSRVLYSNGYVSADKRALVEKAIKEMGYRPNVVARSLRTNRSFTLGLVSNENPANPFFVRIAQEIQGAALQEGLTVLTLNHNGNRAIEKTGIQRFIDQNVDAIIFCSAVDPANITIARRAGVPVVQVERQIAKNGQLALVDPSPGMNDAVAHLYAMQHRKIAFIGAKPGIDNSELPLDQSTEALRVNAFRQALRNHGLEPDEAYIHLGSYYSLDIEEKPQGYILMQKLLQQKALPDAIIAGSDVLVAGALQVLYEHNLRVPDDISIIGYDDSLAKYLTPSLTTIAQPMRALGKAAIQLALHAVSNPSAHDDTQIYSTSLIIRTSTGPAKRPI